MSSPAPRLVGDTRLPLGRCTLAALVFAGSLLLVYAGSFSVPFVFDDIPAIAENPTLRRLWPLTTPLAPPTGGLTVSGRPLLNLSFAANYAMSGLDVRSYHAVNLVIHLLANLTLFGFVRRTLLSPPLAPRFGSASFPLALIIAALWALHPLQTESVTYIVQRAESLGGLFYLFTLYAFARSTASLHAAKWRSVSVAACLCGIASKETAMTAPLLVLAYDAIFVTGSWRGALKQRTGYYLALAASWVLLAFLLVKTGARGNTVGFASTITAGDYLLTQCDAISRYLVLSFWPRDLVLDYGITVVHSWRKVWLQGLFLTMAGGAVLLALWRRRPAAFLGAWFFLVLAPTSSFVPVATQTIAEHRMYLPLAAVVAVVVLGMFSFGGQRMGALGVVAALALGFVTARRNSDYRSAVSIFSDTVAKRPGNWRAQSDLANALVEAGRIEDALPHYESAIRSEPRYAKAFYNLGYSLARLNRLDEAVSRFEQALRLKPDYALAHRGLGEALLTLNQLEAALPHLRFAWASEPEQPNLLNNRANALLAEGKVTSAIATYQGALALSPEHIDARNNLGNALLQAGQPAVALEHYDRVLANAPGNVEAHFGRASAQAQLERLTEAVAEFRVTLELAPDHVPARVNLGHALLLLGRAREAAAAYEGALRLAPHDEAIKASLDLARRLQRE